ncbi:MAG: hypothetical protein V2A73_19005 [Pseudomonadota bacterium]
MPGPHQRLAFARSTSCAVGRSRRAVKRAVTLAAGVALALTSRTVQAYELDISSSSVGQGYQVSWQRRHGSDLLLDRRRFQQTLALSVWDILGPSEGSQEDAKKAPFDLEWDSLVRFSHDFGSYATGDIMYQPGPGHFDTEPAVALVPELGDEQYDFDVVYAFLAARRVWGFLDVQLGRQLDSDDFELLSYDGIGLQARLPTRLPWMLSFEVHGGLTVRGGSPQDAGSSVNEPDGVSSSECVAFDEGIGRFLPAPHCYQRDQPMPALGVALSAASRAGSEARLSYRRSFSPAAPGVYPSSSRSGYATNAESLGLSAQASTLAGKLRPFLAARWSLVLAEIDEARAGVSLGTRGQVVSVELSHSLPGFDADSLFNVFAGGPYRDLRLSYYQEPSPLRIVSIRASAWARCFAAASVGSGLGSALCLDLDSTAMSAGVTVGALLKLTTKGNARLTVYYEDGFGGLQAGSDLAARYRLWRGTTFEARASAMWHRVPWRAELDGASFGIQAGGSIPIAQGVAFRLFLDESLGALYKSNLQILGCLDFFFRPET